MDFREAPHVSGRYGRLEDKLSPPPGLGGRRGRRSRGGSDRRYDVLCSRRLDGTSTSAAGQRAEKIGGAVNPTPALGGKKPPRQSGRGATPPRASQKLLRPRRAVPA